MAPSTASAGETIFSAEAQQDGSMVVRLQPDSGLTTEELIRLIRTAIRKTGEPDATTGATAVSPLKPDEKSATLYIAPNAELSDDVLRALIAQATGEKHGRLTLDGTFSAGLQAGDDILEADYLSKGTSDLTYLALRCALCDEIFRTESPMLVMDETFAHFDKERLNATLPLLNQRQCLVFTCREDEVKAADDMGFSVTRL